MSRKSEYLQYLRSPQWKQLRSEAMFRANGRCEMCGEPARHVHHVKYPKQFKEDHLHNLIALCPSCHARSHGMRYERKQCFEKELQVNNRTKMLVRWCVHRNKYGMDKQWVDMEAIKKAIMTAAGEAMISERALLFKERLLQDGDHKMSFEVMDDRDGMWRVQEFVNEFGLSTLASAFPGTEAERQAHQWFAEIYDNGERLRAEQNKALQAPTNGDPVLSENSMKSFAQVIANGLSPVLAGQQKLMEALHVDLEEVKHAIPLLRDNKEYLPITDRLIQHGIDYNRMAHPSRWNMAEWCGAWLKKHGYQPGERVMQRLSGVGRETLVNTWRACDIDEAIKACLEFMSQQTELLR